MPRFWNCLVWANVRSRQIDANRVLLFVLVCRLSHQVSWPICPGPQKPKIESATWRPRAMYNSRCQGHRGVALLCTTGQCSFEMIRIERNRFNECRQRFRSMLVCKVLARIQDHLQNAEQALYRLRANSIVQICAVCIFTISIHLLILLAFPGIRWKATCYYSSRDERGEDKCDWCELLAASAQKHVLMTLPIFDNLGRFIKPALPLLFWILCKSWADQLEAWRTFGCQYPPPAWWTTPGLNLKWPKVTLSAESSTSASTAMLYMGNVRTFQVSEPSRISCLDGLGKLGSLDLATGMSGRGGWRCLACSFNTVMSVMLCLTIFRLSLIQRMKRKMKDIERVVNQMSTINHDMLSFLGCACIWAIRRVLNSTSLASFDGEPRVVRKIKIRGFALLAFVSTAHQSFICWRKNIAGARGVNTFVQVMSCWICCVPCLFLDS